MDPNLFFATILISSSLFIVCSSENPNGDMQQLGSLLNGGGSLLQGPTGLLQQNSIGNGNPDTLSCINKVAPCQAYLHPESTPPATCCEPLMKMVLNDSKCLCQIFDNPQTLQSLNLTKDDALNLPKACGAKVDENSCKNVTSAVDSTTTPATASNVTTTRGSNSTATAGGTTDGGSTGTNTTDAAANIASKISYFGASGLIAVFMSLFF